MFVMLFFIRTNGWSYPPLHRVYISSQIFCKKLFNGNCFCPGRWHHSKCTTFHLSLHPHTSYHCTVHAVQFFDGINLMSWKPKHPFTTNNFENPKTYRALVVLPLVMYFFDDFLNIFEGVPQAAAAAVTEAASSCCAVATQKNQNNNNNNISLAKPCSLERANSVTKDSTLVSASMPQTFR